MIGAGKALGISPVSVDVKNLTLDLNISEGLLQKTTRKISIIQDVSFSLQPGQFLGILGGSGSSKTSLLNVLAGRLEGTSASIGGQIFFNNGDPRPILETRAAYCQQFDNLMPNLTVRETLVYAAALRLPSRLTDEERNTIIDEVILELGLKEVQNSFVGGEFVRGISGGEKRRTSLAIQLLTNPSILFCDEITTGLDAWTALGIIQTLQKLARQGRTVICTIHAPRSDIFDCFDLVMLMSKGNFCYYGPRSDVLAYFEKQGHPCPEHYSAADFLLDTCSVDTRSAAQEEIDQERVNRLVEAWRQSPLSFSTPSASEANLSVEIEAAEEQQPEVQKPELKAASMALASGQAGSSRASWWGQYVMLTRRAMVNLSRDKLTLYGNLLESTVVAAVVGILFLQLDGTRAGITSRKSLLYLTSSFQPYLQIIYCTHRFVGEMQIFDRERADRMFSVSSWMMANITSMMLPNIIFPFIYAAITYFMANMRNEGSWHFWAFAAVVIGMQQIAYAFALVCISFKRNFAEASLIANSMYTFQGLTCGFFILVSEIPVYLRWIREVSFLYYPFRLLASIEFSDNNYGCPADEIALLGSGVCSLFDGNTVISQLAFQPHDYATPAIAMALFVVGFYLIAGFALTFIPQKIDMSSSPAPLVVSTSPSDKKNSVSVEMASLQTPPAAALSPSSPSSASRSSLASSLISLELQNVTLKVIHKSVVPGKPPVVKPILKGVNAHIPAGAVTCILGSSGAGKSSLLNVLAHRTGSAGGPLSSLVPGGQVLYNGRKLPLKELKSLLSYCMQDDFLLPSLTVRESLHYAARLRLPSDMSAESKIARAEEIILELGLRDCADTLVGNDTMVKGISGGERRRLSIAMQMISNPKVLLLDEPLSGLDAYTARNVFMTLKRIAATGCTLIVSIHQPRSDIVPLFDYTMLMARGGDVVYCGPSDKMMPYFDQLGYPCPLHTNPADHVIDLASVDLRNADAENETRERVQKLIAHYKTYSSSDKGPATSEASDAAAADGDSIPSGGDVPAPASAVAAVSSPSSPQPNQVMDEEQEEFTRMAPFATAYPILVSRSFKNFFRQPLLITARVMQVVSFGIILCVFFARLGSNFGSVQNRVGLLQEVTGLLFVGMLNNIAVFPEERDCFYRERADEAYGTGAFFWAYLTGELPWEILSSVIFSLFICLVVGMQASPAIFFTFFYAVLCIINAGESIGIIFCSLVRHVGFSVSVISLVLSIATLLAGFISPSMPPFFKWINHISIVKYSSTVMSLNEFEGLSFQCLPSEFLPGTNICPVTSGAQVNKLFGFEEDSKASYTVVIGVLAILYRLIAFAVLWFRTRKGSPA